jgi:NAD(P) transhydrogenase
MSADYDFAVIGSGPAGQKAAIAAAKLGKRVVIIDRAEMLGGVSLHRGTIPSKALRESVIHLTGLRHRTFFGADYSHQPRVRIEDLMRRVQQVIQNGRTVVRDQLESNNVQWLDGLARFSDPHTLEVDTAEGDVTIVADNVLIACGTRPVRPDHVPFKARRVMDSDDLAQSVAGKLPDSAIVVGAGVIGLEYASMMAALGIEVTVIDSRETLLDYVDHEISQALSHYLEDNGVTFLLGESVESIRLAEDDRVVAHLASGATVGGGRLLYAVGRQPNTDTLNLEAAGLTPDERGHLRVNGDFQTEVPHIYAAGDVIGPPALASTAMEQGRMVSCHICGVPNGTTPELLPYGIYSIPEISFVGRTERQLESQGVRYEVGVGRFDEVARAQIIGDRVGLLKLVFDPVSLELLGVHIIGNSAAELVHIGLAVMVADGTVETLRHTVFNYPTMAEVYRLAAINGLHKLPSRAAP